MAVPKGIRVRATPDWYVRYLSLAGGFISARPNVHFLYTSLYNNSQSGDYLFVYGLAPVDDVNTTAPIYLGPGTVGSFASNAQRINPSLPAPAGQLYKLDNGASAIGATPTTVAAVTLGAIALGDAPLFVIPPNYSLTIGSEIATTVEGCGFWYIPMVDFDGRRPT